MKLPMLSTDEKIAEIKRLYFRTTRQTIQEDLAKALDLLKSMPGEEDRERATVFMEGLAGMRKEWQRAGDAKPNPTRAACHERHPGSRHSGPASSSEGPKNVRYGASSARRLT